MSPADAGTGGAGIPDRRWIVLLRLLFSLLRIERAGQRHKAVQHDLKSTYAAQRAKADCSSQDFFLQRDLERSQEEDKRKPKR